MSKVSRLRIFDRGAEALTAFTKGEIVRQYACPLCLKLFVRDDAESGNGLTLEHVPPASVGGCGRVLTCRTCNSTAGSTIDAAVANEERHRRIALAMAGVADVKELDARITQFGESVNGVFRVDAARRVIEIDVRAERNDPAVMARALTAGRERASQATGQQHEISITPRIPLDPALARLSDLRAAFLLGFAALGYGFATDPKLVAVREQIARPTERVLPVFWVVFPDAEVAQLRLVALTQPLDALLVELRGTPYLLPLPWSVDGFYDAVRTALAVNSPPALVGEELRQPDDLPMVLDFACARNQ